MTAKDYVAPKSYEDLQRLYGTHICKLLSKHNKVDRNAEDLNGHIWVKLMEADVLDKFEDHLKKQAPKVLSALQACDLLGVSWKQWVKAMTHYHLDPPTVKFQDGRMIEERKGKWMPTPINLAEFQLQGLTWYDSRKAIFAFDDIVRLTLDFRVGNMIRFPFSKMGQEIDSDGNVISEDRPEGNAKIPEVHVTEAQFKNYLTISVLNHYANFCRTLFRRHKERPCLETPEDKTPWESNLPDKGPVSQDVMIQLTDAQRLLKDTLADCFLDADVGKDPTALGEIVFSRLREGASLLQALREVEIPSKVCKEVVEIMRLEGIEYR
jgi:hypothetical protein